MLFCKLAKCTILNCALLRVCVRACECVFVCEFEYVFASVSVYVFKFESVIFYWKISYTIISIDLMNTY